LVGVREGGRGVPGVFMTAGAIIGKSLQSMRWEVDRMVQERRGRN
jgi:hypothetical protein